MALSTASCIVYEELQKLAKFHSQDPPRPMRVYGFGGADRSRCVESCNTAIEELKHLVAFDLFDFMRMVNVVGRSGLQEDMVFRDHMATISHEFWKLHMYMIDPSEFALPFPAHKLSVPSFRVRFQPKVVKMDATPGGYEFDMLIEFVITRGMDLVDDMLELRDIMELRHELEGCLLFKKARVAEARAQTGVLHLTCSDGLK